ncbi:hypothetical protein [Psychroserpens luteus]|uniref:Uncharacterized protein n=1 Tax=Psychroserpens luteus TaxID=1434066 RepID=A0ABW5ZTD9_9FLAO|nr:hypothetical protein [Psychroserpens luteus]
MKNLYLLLISIILFSCGNERILQLPEIENAKITEIHDVSQAYLFYDETKADSVELNRKNLIITTNWLVNVDKRLTLAQAIPKIKFLQDKKRSAELHKNENAKNYFTCSDTSIKNLGFLEFTDVIFNDGHLKNTYSQSSNSELDTSNFINQNHQQNDILIIEIKKSKKWDYLSLRKYLEHALKNKAKESVMIYLNFEKNLSFQDYIEFKSILDNIKIEELFIDNNEFIY